MSDQTLGYCEGCGLLCVLSLGYCPAPPEVEAAYRLGGPTAATTAWWSSPQGAEYRVRGQTGGYKSAALQAELHVSKAKR